MKQVSIHYAKTHLSRLLEDVAAGEDVVIARAGHPVARLLAYRDAPVQRTFGQDEGLFVVPDDFDAPRPLALFDGSDGPGR